MHLIKAQSRNRYYYSVWIFHDHWLMCRAATHLYISLFRRVINAIPMYYTISFVGHKTKKSWHFFTDVRGRKGVKIRVKKINYMCVYTDIHTVLKASSLQVQSAQHKLYSVLSLSSVSWIARQILYPMHRPRDDIANYEKDILWLEKLIDVEGSYVMKVRSSRRTISHKIKT